MAEKIIKTRIKLLYKSFEEWQKIKDTFIPLAGEVCIVNIPASTGEVVDEPATLFKVGDGLTVYAALPYVSAKAADVYTWAKKEYLDWNDLSQDFKDALTKYVGGKSTLYQIVKDDEAEYKWKLQKSEDGGETWVDTTGVIDVSELNKTVDDTAAALQAEVEARENADKEIKDSLATIATTGNVNDLVQTEGDILIIDCN